VCDFRGMLVPIEGIVSMNLQRCENSHYYGYAIVCLTLAYWDDQGILTIANGRSERHHDNRMAMANFPRL
jgi:hypothetical protein